MGLEPLTYRIRCPHHNHNLSIFTYASRSRSTGVMTSYSYHFLLEILRNVMHFFRKTNFHNNSFAYTFFFRPQPQYRGYDELFISFSPRNSTKRNALFFRKTSFHNFSFAFTFFFPTADAVPPLLKIYDGLLLSFHRRYPSKCNALFLTYF